MLSIALFTGLFVTGTFGQRFHHRLHRRQVVVETVVQAAPDVVTVTAGAAVPVVTVTAGAAPPAATVTAASVPQVSATQQADPPSSSSPSASNNAPGSGNEFLDLHNQYRAIHGASPMTWNESLAGIASSYGCAGGDKQAGSNWAGGSDMNTADALWAWYQEESAYAQASNNYQANPNGGPDSGHFSQMVWDASVTLGCAQTSNCAAFSNQFTCLYYPVGNMEVEGQQSYVQNVFPPKNPDTQAALQTN